MRLEVELLASDAPAAVPAPAVGDRPQRHTVLIVVGDADVRRYVRECLHDRAELRLLEAPAAAMAEQLVTLHRPDLLIVDARDAAVLSAIAEVRAVLIADDVPQDAQPNSRIVRLIRPFGGQELEALIEFLLADNSGATARAANFALVHFSVSPGGQWRRHTREPAVIESHSHLLAANEIAAEHPLYVQRGGIVTRHPVLPPSRQADTTAPVVNDTLPVVDDPAGLRERDA